MGDTYTNIAAGNANVGVQIGGGSYGPCPLCEQTKPLTAVVQMHGEWTVLCTDCATT